LILVLIGAVLPGCSMFKAKKRPNLTPFAEHIIAMSKDIRYGFSEEPTIWINQYADDPSIAPLLEDFRTSAVSTRTILRGIVAYSIEVVTLAQSRATGSEQADALADYLNALMRPAFDVEDVDLHITKADFDSIIVDMREQTKLVHGLNSAQPVADEIARIVGEQIAQTELLLYQLNEAIGAAIKREYTTKLEFQSTIKSVQTQTLHSVDLILRASGGDEGALDELWDTDPMLFRGIKRGKGLTDEQGQIVIDRTMARC